MIPILGGVADLQWPQGFEQGAGLRVGGLFTDLSDEHLLIKLLEVDMKSTLQY